MHAAPEEEGQDASKAQRLKSGRQTDMEDERVWLDRVAFHGVLRYICSAGVKMRTVPSMDTVRKAQRKILSNTCATNFQSWTTWIGWRDEEVTRQKKPPKNNFDSNNVANETHCSPKVPATRHLSNEVLLPDVPADVAH